MIRFRTILPAIILSASALMMPSCSSQNSKPAEPQENKIEYISRLESSPQTDMYIKEEKTDLADKQASKTEENKPNWILITLAGLGLTGAICWTHKSIMKNKGDKLWVDIFSGYCGDNNNVN